MGRVLKPKPVYGVSSDQEKVLAYKVHKMDEESLEVLETYSVYKPVLAGDNPGATCDCFAGLQGKFCRHKQIVDLFRAENAVDTPRVYCFDRKYWA